MRINLSMRFRKLQIVILTIVLVLTATISNVSIAHAEPDDQSYFIDPVLPPSSDPTPDPTPDPEPEHISISASTNMVSFGHIEQDSSYVDYQGFEIYNNSNVTVNLDYQLCDAEDIFKLNVPGPLSVAPGQSTSFYVTMDSHYAEGFYSANLIVVPNGDISNTLNIGFSGEIVFSRPYINYMAVIPSNIDLTKGSTYQFSADVRGVNNPRLDVSWSVEGSTSNTTIDNTGVLRIASDENASRLGIKITSLQDPECVEYAVVNIKEGNYNVTTRVNPTNAGAAGGGGTVSGGSSVEVFASPNNGYRFVNWTQNGSVVSNNAKYTINNVRSNYDLVANFELVTCYVKINVNHPEGGSVTNSTNVSYNGSLELKAAAKNGFRFEGWYENGKKFSSDANFKVNGITSNREFTANFEPTVFNVNVKSNPQDTGAVTGTGSYQKGANVVVTAKAYEGYEFDCWTVNNELVSRDANYTIKNIDKDYVVTANFKKKNAKNIQMNSGVTLGSGSISPSGSIVVPEGADVTYTFAPAKGYTINAVIVDGKNVGALPNYTFKKVVSSHTIEVMFTLIPSEPKHDNNTAPTNDPTPANKNEEHQHADIDVVTDEVGHSDSIDNDEEYRPETIDDEDVEAFLDYTHNTGLFQKLNISEDEARTLIREGNDLDLLEEASLEQYLSVSVYNEYASVLQETESVSFKDVISVPNMQDVVSSLLSEDEKIELFKGNPVWINFNLVSNNRLECDDDKLMVKEAMKNGYEIGNFFEAVLMKSEPGYSEMVSELSVPMVIQMNIPANLRAEGREFMIMRAHEDANGNTTIDYLKNESNDGYKIVFTTDKFSDYAIIYKGGKSKGLTQSTILKIFLAVVVVAIIATVILLVYIIKKTKRRRHHRRTNHTHKA